LTRTPRRKFLQQISQFSSLAAFPSTSPLQPLKWTGGEISNSVFRLSIWPSESVNHTRLSHIPTGLLLADAAYSYSFGPPEFRESSPSSAPEGFSLISLRGDLPGGLEILQEFRVSHHQPWLEEQITLWNHGSSSLDLSSWRCGFVLPPAGSWRLLAMAPPT